MNSFELRRILDNHPYTRTWRIPIVTMDDLPPVRVRPSFLLVNTDTSLGRGKHWIVLHFPKQPPDELFDPLGRSTSYYRLERYLKNGRTVLDPIQSRRSRLCGLFCLYYIILRIGGHSLEDVERRFFSENLDRNDRLLKDFFHSYI